MLNRWPVMPVCINICCLYRLCFLLKEPFFTAKSLRLTIKVSYFDIVNGHFCVVNGRVIFFNSLLFLLENA